MINKKYLCHDFIINLRYPKSANISFICKKCKCEVIWDAHLENYYINNKLLNTSCNEYLIKNLLE
jgi:hypothetical protein